jgi:hypothetical protein
LVTSLHYCAKSALIARRTLSFEWRERCGEEFAVTTHAGPAAVRTAAERRQAHRAALAAALPFLVGAMSAVQIANVTATALLVVCLLLAPAFLLMTHRGIDLLPLVLAALGWVSFLVACVVNNVSVLWPNAVAPAAFGLYSVGLTVLTGRTVESIATVLAGIAAGTVGFFFFHGIELTRTGSFLDLWKYGIAHAVTVLLLFVMAKRRANVYAVAAILAALGVASLCLNFRSHALVCIAAAAILFIGAVFRGRAGRAWQFICVAVFVLVFAQLMPIAARAGIFGRALQQKTFLQDQNHLPLLLGGRTEPPMSITAIAERPLLGWGSAMNLPPAVYTEAEHLAMRIGFATPTFPFELYWRLPAKDYSAIHSILLGSWAEGGVVAVLLPVWLLIACIGVVWNSARLGRWAAVGLIVALQGIWDLMYSPWTYNTIPEYACVAILFGVVCFTAKQSAEHRS